MATLDEIKKIITKIVEKTATEQDFNLLRQVNESDDRIIIQSGKQIINLGQGTANHFGDRIYLTLSDEALNALIDLIQEKPKITIIPDNLPYGVHNFIGRTKELNDLHEQLQNNKQIPIITGMGGIGKTELAKQYARFYKNQYYLGGICWLDATSIDSLVTQIIGYGQVKLKIDFSQYLDIKTKVSYCWQQWQELTAGNILIIFNDVTDSDFFKDVNDSNSLKSYQDYLPSDQNQFKIIITTRIKNSSNQFKELSLPELSEDAALELLESFIGKLRLVNELEQAKAICKWLGYLPLGLTLVGQYLVESEYLSLIQMQEKLEKKRLNYDFLTPDDETQRRIKKIFDLSWEELNNKVQKVTYFLSLFAVAPILGSLIEKILPENGEDDWQNILDKILVKRSLLQLQGKEIITNKISKGIYQLHPILREFIYLKLEEYPQKDNIKKEFCCAIVTDIKKQPETLNQKVIDKMKIIYYIPHISEVAISLKTFLKPEDLAIPFISLGRFYCYQGDYGKAMYFARQHLLTSRQVLGKEHINLADAINHLGLIYYHQGDYKKAKARFEKALKIRKKILGEDSLDVADSLDNLAMVYCQIKCYNEAKNLLKQVLKIRKNILGEIHSDIVTNLNNLAGVYYEWGTELELSGYNFDEQRNFGKYLTYCIQARNCYLEAKSLFQEALEISKKVFPSKHSDRASILNNLAGIYRKLGEYNEAESNYVQALTMQIELLGKEHQDVGHSINNLAVLYASQEYYQNAKFLIKQALEIFEKSLGIEHIYTVKIRQNFEEICLEKLGKKLPENKKNKFAEICKLIEFEPDIDSKNN